MKPDGLSRRDLLGWTALAGATVALSARSYGRVTGANDRVTMGVIGCGGRGRFVAQQLLEQKAEFSFLCDPDVSQIAKAQALLPTSVDSDKDFRRAIDRKEVDALLIATPDHWHALPMILAVQAGKDVYIEKPTAYTVGESRAMVEAAKKTKCIIQIGTQQRSGQHYREAVEKIRKGEIGTVSSTIHRVKAADDQPALATRPMVPHRRALIMTSGLAQLPKGHLTPTAFTGTTFTSGTMRVG